MESDFFAANQGNDIALLLKQISRVYHRLAPPCAHIDRTVVA